MGQLLIQRLFGSQAIGNMGEGNGFGSKATGQNRLDLKPFGFLAIGIQEREVGYGSPDIGSIVNMFGVGSSEFGVITTDF
jgi:hypothetical protein